MTVSEQASDMKKVADMLGIKQQHARTLLIHERWDVERLCGNFAEKGKERLFSEAGLPLHASSICACSSRDPVRLTHPFTCEICFDEVLPQAVSTMDCGHSFCNDCKRFIFPFALLYFMHCRKLSLQGPRSFIYAFFF